MSDRSPGSGGEPRTLRDVLVAALAGRPPAPDGLVTVVPPPLGARAAIVAFTGHHVVAAGGDPAWVAARCPPWAFEAPFGPAFVTALATRIGARPGTLDVVLAAGGTAVDAAMDDASPALDLRRLSEEEVPATLVDAPNPRRDAGGWQTAGGTGRLVIGRGLEDRWEAAIDVVPEARGRGLGRALAAAARSIVGPGEVIHVQIAPGNVASLRAVLGAGYRPFAAEILFFD